LKLPNSRKCPLLISNSNFKIQAEFEKLFNMKVVELEILKILYLGNFSSSCAKSKVISKFQIRVWC
jgi:hypothetical protein